MPINKQNSYSDKEISDMRQEAIKRVNDMRMRAQRNINNTKNQYLKNNNVMFHNKQNINRKNKSESSDDGLTFKECNKNISDVNLKNESNDCKADEKNQNTISDVLSFSFNNKINNKDDILIIAVLLILITEKYDDKIILVALIYILLDLWLINNNLIKLIKKIIKYYCFMLNNRV